MDTSDPRIVFDAEGNCNHCSGYFKTGKRVGNQSLEQVLQRIREAGKHKRYDCLLGIGGGADGSYTAYLAYRYGLRVLLFHMDNGWNTSQAEHNIKAITDKTGFPLLRVQINYDEFNDVVLSFLKASVIDLEVATDHAATALYFQVARAHGIDCLLTGCNFATEAIMPQAWGYRKDDLPNLRAIHKQFGEAKLDTYPTISLVKLAFLQTVKQMFMVPLLNYIRYNREEAKEVLARFCGWQDYGLKHYESDWTRFYQRYILPVKFHVDKRRAHLSSLICSSQITREQALAELEKPLYATGERQREKTFTLQRLGLTARQFDRLMKRQVRRHQEYGSDEWFYKLLKNSRAVVRCIYFIFRKIHHRKRLRGRTVLRV